MATAQISIGKFMPVIQQMLRTSAALSEYSERHIKKTGLTAHEFDVLVVLGQEDGQTFKEICEKTHITKTTLTGVIDKLEEKKLVERYNCPDDRRCIRAYLTQKGKKKFAAVFPEHVTYLQARFGGLSEKDIQEGQRFLRKIADLL